MEVAHVNYVTLVTKGQQQWLCHAGTGEALALDTASPRYVLGFSESGKAFLNPLVGDAGDDSIWANTLLTSSFHIAKDGRHFVKQKGGKVVWQEKLLELRKPRVWRCVNASGQVLARLQVWVYTIAIAGAFVFWDLPYFVHAVLGRYSDSLLRARVKTVKRCLRVAGLGAAHVMGSWRSLVTKATFREQKPVPLTGVSAARSTMNCKISTTALLWSLGRAIGEKRGRRDDSKAECDKSTAILNVLVQRFLTADDVLLTYVDGVGQTVSVCVADGVVPAAALRTMLGTKKFNQLWPAPRPDNVPLAAVIVTLASFVMSKPKQTPRLMKDRVVSFFHSIAVVIESQRGDLSQT